MENRRKDTCVAIHIGYMWEGAEFWVLVVAGEGKRESIKVKKYMEIHRNNM